MPGSEIGENGDADRSRLDDAVRAEQIRLLYQQRAVVPVNLVIACLTVAAVRPFYPIWALTLWLGSFCALIVARILLRLRYRTKVRGAETAQRWGRLFTLGAFATGCLWGLTASIVLVTPDPISHVFIVFVLGGMMAAGIVSNTAYLPAMLGFMLPTIAPMIAVLVTRYTLSQTEMAVMLTAFTAVLVIVGRNINRSIIENLRLRFEQNILSTKLEASEAAMAEAQAIAHVGSWEFDPRSDNVVWATETFRIYGVDPSTFKPSYEAMMARVHPDDREAVGKNYAELTPTRPNHGIDCRLVMDDGAIKSVHVNAQAIHDAQGRPLRIFGTVQDITERKNAEDELLFANILLTTEMETSPDGILVVDADRTIISFNQRFADMWRIPPTQLEARRDEIVMEKVTSSVKDPQKFSMRVQYLYEHPGEISRDELETTDGRFIDRYTATLHTPAGVNLGRVWFFHDVTERKQSEAQVLRMARNDGLTGLANRSAYVEALKHAIAKAKRNGKGFAVIYLDLDHFKDVNDTLGHPVGDGLLNAVAERLRSNTRDADTVARFGGDEFAVIAEDISEPADAAILADNLINAIAAPF